MNCSFCNVIRHLIRFILAFTSGWLLISAMYTGYLIFKLGDFLTCENYSDEMLEDVKHVVEGTWKWILFRGKEC